MSIMSALPSRHCQITPNRAKAAWHEPVGYPEPRIDHQSASSLGSKVAKCGHHHCRRSFPHS